MEKRVYIFSGEFEYYMYDKPKYLTSVAEIDEELYKRIRAAEEEYNEIQKIMDKLYAEGKSLDSTIKVKIEENIKRKMKGRINES